MADEADLAQDIQDLRLQAAIDNRVIYQGESAKVCIHCDEPIPERRRQILPGVQTCVSCAKD